MKMKTTENLNLRTGPSVTKPVIITIPKGTLLEVDSVNKGWAYTTYKEDSGYCSTRYLKKVPISSPAPVWIRPSLGVVTSEYGTRTLEGVRNIHFGMDIAKPGNVRIVASADGKVVKSYFSSSYGECILLQHVIEKEVFETLYAHMKAGSRKVKVGDKVKKGQTIGLMGNTGNSTGQHLHFELHKPTWNVAKSNAVNPREYIKF